MKGWMVRVREYFTKDVYVEAETSNEAAELVEDMYENGEIEITYHDYDGFVIEEPQEDE